MSPLAEALGGVSLPLSLGIVATDISLCDNEGAMLVQGEVGGRKTKNVSSRELRGLQSLGIHRGICIVLLVDDSRVHG